MPVGVTFFRRVEVTTGCGACPTVPMVQRLSALGLAYQSRHPSYAQDGVRGGGYARQYRQNRPIAAAQFDPQTRHLLDKEKRNGAYGVAFSPDGKVLASGSENQTVELWNAETGEHIATLSGYEGRGYFRRVFSVAFSPDGSILATGTWEGTIKLWDVATRTEIITFKHGGDEGRIMSLAFSPDGKILASALTDDWTSAEHTVKLWDTATRTEIATLRGHKNGVQSVSFSPDGKTLASGAL